MSSRKDVIDSCLNVFIGAGHTQSLGRHGIIVKAINSPTSRAWGRDDITVIVNKKTGLIDLNKTITLDNINWDYYDDVELFGKIIKLIKIN